MGRENERRDRGLLTDVRALALALERSDRWPEVARMARELAERHGLDGNVVLSVVADEWDRASRRPSAETQCSFVDGGSDA